MDSFKSSPCRTRHLFGETYSCPREPVRLLGKYTPVSVKGFFRRHMGTRGSNREDGQAWESVHVSPNCGHVINLAELYLRAITTGIVTCPSCSWSGQIEIEVVARVPRKKAASAE